MSDTEITEIDDQPSITLEEEMKTSYLDYAMSVIVSRALPDIRDGLKPVHRRILFAMREGGYTSDKPFRKSARIVGDVMGKYHPHGDSAIYDALVRMAQDFSMRLPLIHGQGNFGSMDGDPAAAMRYTEARLYKAAEAILEDIEKDTVDFIDNYDGSQSEPLVLPSRIPNLLVNGAGGIAVGMATNIPPHNLVEVIDACHAFIDNPEITTEEIMEIIPGPDFPTGGQILGRSGTHKAYTTGNGSVIMRAKTEVEEKNNGRQSIVVSEVPYQVNKGRLLERLGEVGREKIVEDISEIRDESDRDGVRIVIDLKKGANADVVLNQLFKHTALRTNFPCNMVALNHGRPEMLILKDFIRAFVHFREDVITRRTIFELGKARDRAHILAGLAVAVANIDEIIKLIRNASDPHDARAQLLAKAWPAGEVSPLIELIDDPEHMIVGGTYQMSETQAKAILDLRLHRLTGLERDKIGDELRQITDRIAEYLAILASREKMLEVMREELDEIKEKFGTPRRTVLMDAEFEEDIEDLIQREDMVVTVTNSGYVKRVPLSTYRAQRRGGKGRAGVAMKDEDFVSDMFVASTHTPILFFTSRGIVHKMKVWQLPQGSPTSRGKALVNLLPLEEGENISVYLRTPEDEEVWGKLDIMFATSHGSVRRNKLTDFQNIRSNGLIAMKLSEDESLVSVKICKDDEDVMLATKLGKAIRFSVDDVRVFSGRTSTGVRGIRIGKGDEVISMSILKHMDITPDERNAYLKAANKLRGADEEGVEFDDGGDAQLSEERFRELQENEQFLLNVTVGGFGKRTSAYEYRVTGRGGQGVVNMSLTEKNGKEMAATFPVTDDHQVMLISDMGQMIRMPVSGVRFTGRSAQGVTLFKVAKNEHVVSVAWLIEDDEEEAALDGDGALIGVEGEEGSVAPAIESDPANAEDDALKATPEGEAEVDADDAAPETDLEND
jgi:DNA gyrase subunit A